MSCPLCPPNLPANEIILENEYCLFLQRNESILMGSGLIITRVHRETVFDMTAEEWQATYDLLHHAKRRIEQIHRPDGYNLGWNCSAVAGQEVFHVHLHIIPRFADEPLAGKGIRYWLKQEANRRKRPPKFSH